MSIPSRGNIRRTRSTDYEAIQQVNLSASASVVFEIQALPPAPGTPASPTPEKSTACSSTDRNRPTARPPFPFPRWRNRRCRNRPSSPRGRYGGWRADRPANTSRRRRPENGSSGTAWGRRKPPGHAVDGMANRAQRVRLVPERRAALRARRLQEGAPVAARCRLEAFGGTATEDFPKHFRRIARHV